MNNKLYFIAHGCISPDEPLIWKLFEQKINFFDDKEYIKFMENERLKIVAEWTKAAMTYPIAI